MDEIYESIDEYIPNRDQIIVFKVFRNLKHSLLVTKSFITGRKLNISLDSITKSYFAVPKNMGLNSTHYFIMKVSNRVSNNHFSDIDKDFFNLYKITMQNDIIFWQTIQCCHKIILYVKK